MKNKKRNKCVQILIGMLLIVVAASFCAGGVLLLQGYAMYTGALEALPVSKAVEEVRGKDGFTPLEDLPETYTGAVVAAEDHRFYQHGGVDFLALCRAAVNDIRTLSLAEGGSTITQQLAKNLYFTQEKEFTRKIAEMFMAWKLESDLEKDEILELYVNCIYFGSGCYTVGDACRTYFHKAPADMTDCEATLLAGIPNAPSVYDLNENPGLAYQRQRQVVGLMVKYAGLDQARADNILSHDQKGGTALCAGS